MTTEKFLTSSHLVGKLSTVSKFSRLLTEMEVINSSISTSAAQPIVRNTLQGDITKVTQQRVGVTLGTKLLCTTSTIWGKVTLAKP